MNLINRIKFDPSFPIVARAAGRSIVGSIHFALIAAASAAVRRDIAGVPVPTEDNPDPQNHIDNANEAVNAANEHAEELRIRREQGFETDEMDTEGGVSEFASTPEDPMVLASLLKVIGDHISEDLQKNAGTVKLLLTDKLAPNPFDIASSISESLERQIKFSNEPNAAVVEATAKALGITKEEVLSAHSKQQQAQANFLRTNRSEILGIIKNLHWRGDSDMDAEIAETRLPAINKLRLLKAAETGLFAARGREITNYTRFGLKDAPGNIKAIDGLREELHDEFDAILKDPHSKKELEEAEKRGAALPQMNPRPSDVIKAAAKAA